MKEARPSLWPPPSLEDEDPLEDEKSINRSLMSCEDPTIVAVVAARRRRIEDPAIIVIVVVVVICCCFCCCWLLSKFYKTVFSLINGYG
jgi:hypothetical protein